MPDPKPNQDTTEEDAVGEPINDDVGETAEEPLEEPDDK